MVTLIDLVIRIALCFTVLYIIKWTINRETKYAKHYAMHTAWEREILIYKLKYAKHMQFILHGNVKH